MIEIRRIREAYRVAIWILFRIGCVAVRTAHRAI